MPVELGLKLVTSIGLDRVDPKRESLDNMIHEVHRVGLSVACVYLQCPNACCVINGCVLESLAGLSP